MNNQNKQPNPNQNNRIKSRFLRGVGAVLLVAAGAGVGAIPVGEMLEERANPDVPAVAVPTKETLLDSHFSKKSHIDKTEYDEADNTIFQFIKEVNKRINEGSLTLDTRIITSKGTDGSVITQYATDLQAVGSGGQEVVITSSVDNEGTPTLSYDGVFETVMKDKDGDVDKVTRIHDSMSLYESQSIEPGVDEPYPYISTSLTLDDGLNDSVLAEVSSNFREITEDEFRGNVINVNTGVANIVQNVRVDSISPVVAQ